MMRGQGSARRSDVAERMVQALKWLTACAALVVPLSMAHAGSSPQHSRDESTNARGPNRCTQDSHCDGLRTCSSSGWCQGEARPQPSAPSRPPPSGTPHYNAPPPRPEPHRPPVPEGPRLPQRRIQLQSRLADVLASVEDHDRRQGSAAIVAPPRRRGRDNMSWDLIPVPGGFYIQNRDTGRVLDIEGANPNPAAHVITWPYSGASHQLWRFVPSPVPGYFYIQSQLNGFVLDIEGGNTSHGALIAYPMNRPASDNQLWRIVSR
ncbi:RICIN domain-containing protein [Stigmatella erecta]|uniref:Ricin-type beta-trefoil lectin domain-like n=1 Tax=Stigmatella erecta TaxID=83460 RepID=A0A1I0F3I9_9BACT|nr:RICIN domain-containing protein [Stigmatella erecta]SET52229.1 Ricin-type beta-trefoil lectin domain-like [Stigmatella erecta]